MSDPFSNLAMNLGNPAQSQAAQQALAQLMNQAQQGRNGQQGSNTKQADPRATAQLLANFQRLQQQSAQNPQASMAQFAQSQSQSRNPVQSQPSGMNMTVQPGQQGQASEQARREMLQMFLQQQQQQSIQQPPAQTQPQSMQGNVNYMHQMQAQAFNQNAPNSTVTPQQQHAALASLLAHSQGQGQAPNLGQGSNLGSNAAMYAAQMGQQQLQQQNQQRAPVTINVNGQMQQRPANQPSRGSNLLPSQITLTQPIIDMARRGELNGEQMGQLKMLLAAQTGNRNTQAHQPPQAQAQYQSMQPQAQFLQQQQMAIQQQSFPQPSASPQVRPQVTPQSQMQALPQQRMQTPTSGQFQGSSPAIPPAAVQRPPSVGSNQPPASRLEVSSMSDSTLQSMTFALAKKLGQLENSLSQGGSGPQGSSTRDKTETLRREWRTMIFTLMNECSARGINMNGKNAPALGTAQQPINLTGNSPFPPTAANLANSFPQQFSAPAPQQQQLQQMLNMQAQSQTPQVQTGQANYQANTTRPAGRPGLSKDKFFDSLNALFNRNGMKPVEPKVEGRGVDLYALHNLVARAGGSAKVSNVNGWPLVAGQMGWTVPGAQPPRSSAEVGNALARVFQELLGDFETMYTRLMQTQDASSQQPFTQMRPPDSAQGQVPGNTSAEFVSSIAGMPMGQIQGLGLQSEQLRLVQQYRNQQTSPQGGQAQVQRPPVARQPSQTAQVPPPQAKNHGTFNAQQVELAKAMIASIEQGSRQSIPQRTIELPESDRQAYMQELMELGRLTNDIDRKMPIFVASRGGQQDDAMKRVIVMTMYARMAVASAQKNQYHFQLHELAKIKQLLSQFYPMFQPVLAQLTAYQQQRQTQSAATEPSPAADAGKLQRGLRVEDLKQPPMKRQKIASSISSPSPASQQAPTPQDPKTPATPGTSSPRPGVKRSASKKQAKSKASISKLDDNKVDAEMGDKAEENALGIKLGEDIVTQRRLEADAGKLDPLGLVTQAWGDLEKTETNDWLAGLSYDLQRASGGGSALVEAASLDSPLTLRQDVVTETEEETFDYSSFIDDSALALDSAMPTPDLVPPTSLPETSPDSDTAVSPPSPVIIATQSPPQETVCLGESIEDQWFNGFGNGGWKWEGEFDGGSWAIEGINA